MGTERFSFAFNFACAYVKHVYLLPRMTLFSFLYKITQLQRLIYQNFKKKQKKKTCRFACDTHFTFSSFHNNGPTFLDWCWMF